MVFTYFLTYLIKQSPWEVNSLSSSQEIRPGFSTITRWEPQISVFVVLRIYFWLFTDYNQQDATFHNSFISVRRCTCFRRFFRPSSGAQNCTYSVRYSSDQYCYLMLAAGRHQLKCDGTRRRTGGEVKGKLANGVGSQYPSQYLRTWCIQNYYRWCAPSAPNSRLNWRPPLI